MTEAEKAYQYFVIAVPENEEQAKAYFWARKALQSTLTQPNEPLTLEELKAEAKRQGYKLIKDKHPRFERCLCGHNVHQWVSVLKSWASPKSRQGSPVFYKAGRNCRSLLSFFFFKIKNN